MASADTIRLVPLDRSGLPEWCDRYLPLPGSGRFFAGRTWYDAVLGHAVPSGAEPVLATCADGAVLLPLLRTGGRRLQSLTTPYSLLWEPLLAPGADASDLKRAGRGLGRLLRFRPPMQLEALDGCQQGGAALDALRAGAWRAGLPSYRYAHFGNWHEAPPPPPPSGGAWDAYLGARPPALRTTILRKMARCDREMRFAIASHPGRELEAAITAYETVYGRSWKPAEPHPSFNAALMRAAAASGELRLGVLWAANTGAPVAAQYWIVSGGQAWLLKLVHDETQRAASPGTALTAMMIRHLLDAEGGMTDLDFGRGDDPYKRLWVSQRRQRTGLLLAGPLHPAGLLEAARQGAARVVRHARAQFGNNSRSIPWGASRSTV